jgi:carbohydrate kinase (thermoresistant glucokinase family)
VVACSALKRAYRDRLRQADPDLRSIYLQCDRGTISARLAQRVGHFFPPGLLDAQFADLEEPGPDEHPITVPIGQTPSAEVDDVMAALDR